MTREDIVVGLDIGTTKVCTVVGQGDARGDINVIGVGVVPSRGIKKGVVVDVEDTIAAIKASVDRARHMAGVPVESVVAGVTGDHVQSSNQRGTVTVASPEGVIGRADVERVLQAAALELAPDREIIHSLPRDFIVDGHRGVRRPMGMAGQRLEVETHVVTGSSSFLHNVAKCVEGAGLHVEALVLEPFATADAVASADEREMGVALIDIGGGTSDIAVFVDGSIAFSSVISVGGNHVTRDIAIGLRTPFEIAERLKIERGAAMPSLISHGEALEVMMAGSGERLRIPRALLGEIIEARMSELFEMARDALQNAGVMDRLPGGVILSGGGALLPGVVDLAQTTFHLPVRLGYPIGILGWSEEVDNPQFATGVGLCRFALKARRAVNERGELPIPATSAGRRIWGAPHTRRATPAARVQTPTAPSAPPPVASPVPPASIPTSPASAPPVPQPAKMEDRPPAVLNPASPAPAPKPAPPAPKTVDETPFDRHGESRFLRRDELLARQTEPESPLRRFINKVRHFIGFEDE